MLRKASEAVPEGNDPVPQKEELGSGQPKMEDVYRMMKEALDRWDKKLNEISDKMDELSDVMNQHETRLEHGARQPRLATEADGQQADTRTRQRTEGAATAAQAMRGDRFSARRVEPAPKTYSTSVGMMAEPPALPCRDDAVVESPFLEMRSPSAAGGLLPTGEAFSATRTTLNKPPLRYYSTEETDSKTNWRTRTRYVSYDSNFLLAANSFRKIRVYVRVREQIENLAAKQNQESREIAPWKPSAQHTPKPNHIIRLQGATTKRQP